MPSVRRQLVLLLALYWKHMRRRPARLGAAPKLSGVPTFLLLNLMSLAYLAPMVWRTVAKDVERAPGSFAWHALGIVLLGLGSGTTAGAAAFQVQGVRSDAFLDSLPVSPAARLALQLADGALIVSFTSVIGLAGLSAYSGLTPASALASAVLGPASYAACFVLGNAGVTWARAWGPPSTARRAGFVGVGLTFAGFLAAAAPSAWLVIEWDEYALALTHAWLGGGWGIVGLYAGALCVGGLAYVGLLRAHRVGFDHLPPARSVPRALAGAPSRRTLEWQMMLRQGGAISVAAISLVLLGFAVQFFGRTTVHAIPAVVPIVAGLAVYLGAVQTIGHAGRAARSDLSARPFLSALPLSPHQVTEGKARVLRTLLIPVLAMLASMSVFCALQGELSWAYRLLLALSAVYVAVDGCVSIAFLSHGVGVAGVAGGQVSSSFSTQLLMIPLLTTVFATDAWAASVALLAVSAVAWEAKRAAAKSVRWLDDPDDALERETTVWRALLAATAFFAVQVLGFRMLELFEVPSGYTMAIAFAGSALVLGLLTFRSADCFEGPRFLPSRAVAWPLGAIGGAASGVLARGMGSLIERSPDAQAARFTGGEAIAVFATLVVLAPLAEEYFFRGWLQKAIEKDLPARLSRWAFVPGACAFALAHVGGYGVPQLVLGLIAGALYAAGGGLWPAILAHAVHNGVVLLWP
jgi:membrane protease YdiL (CAAX protease family)